MSGKSDKKATKDSQSVDQTTEEHSPVSTEAITEIPGNTAVEDEESVVETAEVRNEGVSEKSAEELLQEIEVQKKLVAEHRDRALRAQAELENVRKRTLRDIENAHKYALERFINELLPVLDSMELGLSASAPAEKGAQQTRNAIRFFRTCVLSCRRAVVPRSG